MPLTHRPPPQPVAATHAAEVATHSDEYAQGVRDYLHTLFDTLILPHTEWSRGVGQSATPTAVVANVGPSPQSAGVVPATFPTLGVTATTASVAAQGVLLAIALLKREPAPRWDTYFDGVLLRATPNTVPLPPPLPAPVLPDATPPMEDVDDDAEPAYVDAQASYEAAFLVYTIDQVWHARWAHVTHWWHGLVESVSLSAKTVSVRLDPFPDAQDSVTQTCGFGTRAWTATELQGKRVRVGWDRAIGWWVDDWA